MIVLESNNPEESKIVWFAYVPKNRVNSETWIFVCEHLNNLEIPPENTLGGIWADVLIQGGGISAK